jgi:hypothetical protein
MGMPGKDVIFILSSGRSGSSALTRVLSLCGCTLPPAVLAPRELNPTGFWEPVAPTLLNFQFMERHCTAESDPLIYLPGEKVYAQDEREAFIGEIRGFLTACPSGSALLLKCAGIAELMEFWTEACHRENFCVKTIISLRNPREVFASWKAAAPGAQTAAGIELIYAAWIKENLLAERLSRGSPRVVVEYANLLADWRTEVARVARELSIQAEINEAAVEGFLNPRLHRQRCAGEVTETFGDRWISRIYSALARAARDLPIDSEAMDEIFWSYRNNEHVTQELASEFRRTFDPGQFYDAFAGWPVWRAGVDY